MKRKIILSFFAVLAMIMMPVLITGCTLDDDEEFILPTAVISYNTGENASVIPDTTIEIGSKISEPTAPTRSGYQFDGWTMDGEDFVFGYMPNQNITLTAKWIKKYTITFITGSSDSVVEQIQEIAGTQITLPQVSRNGYQFDGWKLNGEYCNLDAVPAQDITLYAEWTKVFTITFETGFDDYTIEKIVKPAGENITKPQANYAGYIFEGWLLDGEEFEFVYMPNKDITLTAKWTRLYTLCFETGLENHSLEPIIKPADTPIELPVLEREGYQFDGWLLDDEIVNYSVMPQQDLTLTAKWIKKYTITFETGVENCTVEPIVAVAGTKISEPQVNRSGYYVLNWKNGDEIFEFDKMPSENITLTAEWLEVTNLPAMLINLADSDGNTILLDDVTKEEYVSSSISLVNTDADFTFKNVASQFKGRGNGSWEEAKKCYRLKFDKKQSLFGHAANKHWVLIACANFDDVTMHRNYLAYSIAREELDGIEYTTSTDFVDLYVNGEYRGVYLLCEHVRVDKSRVNIKSDFGVEDTGYLIEYDAYATGENGVDYIYLEGLGLKYSFTIHSPDPEEYLDEGLTKEEYRAQIAYIQDYLTRVYTAALTKDYETFAELVDVDSFVDMYILHELFKNTDTGWSSFYLYKKPQGKLYAGPAWDFDATTTAARGDNTPQGIFVAGSVVDESEFTSCELYISLYQTEGFKQAVVNRWKEISSTLADFVSEKLSDDMIATNKTAMGKNFALWKNKTQEDAENDWVQEVLVLKNWLLARIAWLDTEWV